jgi:hypothetical protein
MQVEILRFSITPHYPPLQEPFLQSTTILYNIAMTVIAALRVAVIPGFACRYRQCHPGSRPGIPATGVCLAIVIPQTCSGNTSFHGIPAQGRNDGGGNGDCGSCSLRSLPAMTVTRNDKTKSRVRPVKVFSNSMGLCAKIKL